MSILLIGTNKNKADLESKIAAGGDKVEKYQRQLATKNTEIEKQTARLGDLTNSKNELVEMGADENVSFTYQSVTGNTGETNREGDLVTIKYNGTYENGIHESAHGYQKLKGDRFENSINGWADREMVPYQRQFSFMNNVEEFNIGSPSNWGKVGKRSDINRNWIHFINDGRSYPYLQGLSISTINELLKLKKGQ